MKFDTETIIEETEMRTNSTEPVLEKRTQSILCALKLHRRTRWSRPFKRTVTGVVMFTSEERSQDYFFQVRECLGCGMREERMLGND